MFSAITRMRDCCARSAEAATAIERLGGGGVRLIGIA
jgi:hypothetical protein